MADVDQGHDDENCEGDFLISCISERVVPDICHKRHEHARVIFFWPV